MSILTYPKPVVPVIDGNSMSFTATCADWNEPAPGTVWMDPGGGATPTKFLPFTHIDQLQRIIAGFGNDNLTFTGEPGSGGPALAVADPNGSIGIMFTTVGNPATQVVVDPTQAVWSQSGGSLLAQIPAAAAGVTGVKVDYSRAAVGSDGAGGISVSFPIVP